MIIDICGCSGVRRLRQFFRAVTGRVTDGDRAFVQEYLGCSERELFFAMSEADQVHALGVARTAEQLAVGTAADRRLLMRAALLHDVGRVRGDMGVVAKSLAVIIVGLFPKMAREFAQYPRYPLGTNFLHIYFFHPRIGAAKLRALGLDAEADLAARHHSPPAPGDTLELDILRAADELN